MLSRAGVRNIRLKYMPHLWYNRFFRQGDSDRIAASGMDSCRTFLLTGRPLVRDAIRKLVVMGLLEQPPCT
ncbi:MAG: hypothetical protein CSB33_01990 [Desulfobacterales bacterium]|nr:MAG: hypothetical protein CSB33_01990 [Desulfobacterales bacterium]